MNASDVLVPLVRSSLEGGAVLLAAWAVTRLWPAMPAGPRLALWWFGSLRMLAGLVTLPTLRLPWLPGGSLLPESFAAPVLVTSEALAGAASAAPDAVTTGAVAASLPWLEIAAIVAATAWLAGVLASVLLLARRLARLRRAWHEARPLDDPRVAALRAEWALALGPRRVPEIRVGDGVDAPIALGFLRPGLLLPAGAAALPDHELRLVLAHEMSHVRRRDLVAACVPAAAQVVFWFHPLVRFAGREYLAAREELCDAEALAATGAAPRDYGALLVAFGTGRAACLPGTASCGSPDVRHLKRRLAMLSLTSPVPRAHRAGASALAVALLLLAFAPVRLVAAREGDSKDSGGRRSARPEVAYLLKTKGVEGTRGSIHSSDFEMAKSLKDAEEDAVYFRLGDRAWTTGDPDVVAEVRRALVPEDAFDARQAEFERRRAPIERRNEVLEERFHQIEERKSALEERKAAVQERLDEARAEGRDLRRLRGELEELRGGLEALRRDQEDLHLAKRELSDRLQELFAAEKETWAEQERVHAQVLREIERIARRALSRGALQPAEY